ncbi:MAG: helix-turn-helix domain-containing protein [Steroidobacteraceae bacterium]|jgi:HTH-type transcriptional regulator/antitoxin HipB
MAWVALMPLMAYIAPVDYLLQTPAQLAKHLPSLRNARHLTQAQLGMLVGLDQTRIAKIEANPQRVSVGQLFKILGALGVQLQLLSDEGGPNPKAPPAAADW